MLEINKNRWDICAIDPRLSRFCVTDRLLRKRVDYYVPGLMDVSIEGSSVYVETFSGKKFLIDLGSNSRRLI